MEESVLSSSLSFYKKNNFYKKDLEGAYTLLVINS